MSGPRERVAAVDVLRGIAIAAVVMRHVSWRLVSPQSLAAPGGSILVVTHLASDLGVPLFVAISAFSLAWRHAAPLGGLRGYAGFLASRASRLLPAYGLWSLVSLLARDPSLLASPRGVASALLFGTADVQFYFVPMVFELFLLWPFLRPLGTGRGLAGAAAFLVFGFATADLAWRAVFVSPWTPLLYFAGSAAIGTGLREVVGDPPFSSPPGRAAWAASALLAAIAAAGLFVSASRFLVVAPAYETRGPLYILAMMSSRQQGLYTGALTVALALIVVPLSRTRAGLALASLGRASYGVYFVHLLVASTFVYRSFSGDAAVPGGAIGAVARLFAVWAVTLAASWALVKAVEIVPALRWTVGGHGGSHGLAPPPVASTQLR